VFWPLPPLSADDEAEAYINKIEQWIMAAWKPPKNDWGKAAL